MNVTNPPPPGLAFVLPREPHAFLDVGLGEERLLAKFPEVNVAAVESVQYVAWTCFALRFLLEHGDCDMITTT